MSLSKYLDKDAVEKYIGSITIDPSFSPLSQDSYNERAILKAIADTGRQEELLYAAINMAVVGYGNKKYGNYRVRDKIIDILQLMLECGVKTGLGRDARLSENDLTPGRLCRAFRHFIKAYIEANHYESYLYRKYTDKDPRFMNIMFRGAEYLDNLNKEEVEQIIIAHERLDSKHGINISERVLRVLQAKGAVKRGLV
jgi:hypothetical protein